MLEYVMLPAAPKQSYGNKAEWYSERIVAEAKQESLLLYTDNVKITPVDYYDSVALPLKLAFLSSHSTMKWWLILYILVARKDDVTNYIQCG